MTDAGKTVAVVMCTYNGERYIARQLDSILSQTYPVSEIIVQDDCSTDDTVSIVEAYARRHPVIRLYRNAVNMGFNRNFRLAVKHVSASFVALSDQDDVWMPQKIERQVEAIGDNNICCSDHLRGSEMSKSHVVSPRYTLEALLFGGFAGHTMLLRRDFVQRDEAWIDGIYYDWGLAVSAWLLGNKGITHVPVSLNWHRLHDNEAARLQHLSVYPDHTATRAWQPYVYGWAHYRRLQRLPAWRRLYNAVNEATSEQHHALAHSMSRLMLRRGLSPLLRLCILCMLHRHDIYPDPRSVRGPAGVLRGFFFPLIFAYRNTLFAFN